MSERDIRALIRRAFAALDDPASHVIRNGARLVIYPAVLGAGLALGGCGDDTKAHADATLDKKTTPVEFRMGPEYGMPGDLKPKPIEFKMGPEYGMHPGDIKPKPIEFKMGPEYGMPKPIEFKMGPEYGMPGDLKKPIEFKMGPEYGMPKG